MAATATLTLPDAATAAPTNEGSIFHRQRDGVAARCWLHDPDRPDVHPQARADLARRGLHTTRLTDPAMELADLPPLDLVLLSHFHGDHFDQVAERDLDRALPIVTTPQSAKDLEERGFTKCIPLDVWESLNVEKGPARLRITATPARHGPPMVDLVLPDVMGSVLDVTMADGGASRIYITGDTLVIDELREIPQRFPDIDIALLHLGGTRVLGILVSMDAKQGVEAMRIVDPALAIPIHYNDYDVFTSPLSDFQEEVRAAGWRTASTT